MPELQVGQSYDKILKDRKFNKYYKKPPKGTFGAPKPVTLPPMNTDIRFSAILPIKPKTFMAGAKRLPVTWNWRDVSKSDSPGMKLKKRQITKPQTQGLCGSCSYMATAGTVGDVFVTSGKVRANPNISAAYLMSCGDRHGDCSGSNPALNILNVQESGISTNDCINYSFCTKDNICNGDSTQHFDAEQETARLNSLIPPCACSASKTTGLKLFFVRRPETVHMASDTDTSVRELIKQHIYNVGPVCAGYHIFSNFFDGDFSDTNGIYMERYDYANHRWYKEGEQPEYKGSHAVCCLGWGVGKVNGDRIPYWYCRNSWGSGWGMDKGYFKIACYPFNVTSQFDREVTLQPGNVVSGGFITFLPGKIEMGNTKNYKNSKFSSNKTMARTRENFNPFYMYSDLNSYGAFGDVQNQLRIKQRQLQYSEEPIEVINNLYTDDTPEDIMGEDVFYDNLGVEDGDVFYDNLKDNTNDQLESELEQDLVDNEDYNLEVLDDYDTEDPLDNEGIDEGDYENIEDPMEDPEVDMEDDDGYPDSEFDENDYENVDVDVEDPVEDSMEDPEVDMEDPEVDVEDDVPADIVNDDDYSMDTELDAEDSIDSGIDVEDPDDEGDYENLDEVPEDSEMDDDEGDYEMLGDVDEDENDYETLENVVPMEDVEDVEDPEDEGYPDSEFDDDDDYENLDEMGDPIGLEDVDSDPDVVDIEETEEEAYV